VTSCLFVQQKIPLKILSITNVAVPQRYTTHPIKETGWVGKKGRKEKDVRLKR